MCTALVNHASDAFYSIRRDHIARSSVRNPSAAPAGSESAQDPEAPSAQELLTALRNTNAALNRVDSRMEALEKSIEKCMLFVCILMRA